MKLLFENWRQYLNEIRFRASNLKELGVIIDSLIEKFYNGELGEDETFQELKIYLSAFAEENEKDVDTLIDELVSGHYSSQLDGLLFDPSYREMLK